VRFTSFVRGSRTSIWRCQLAQTSVWPSGKKEHSCSSASCQSTFFSGQVHSHVPRPNLEATSCRPSGLNASVPHQYSSAFGSSFGGGSNSPACLPDGQSQIVLGPVWAATSSCLPSGVKRT
jgi:hypothetical protein